MRKVFRSVQTLGVELLTAYETEVKKKKMKEKQMQRDRPPEIEKGSGVGSAPDLNLAPVSPFPYFLAFIAGTFQTAIFQLYFRTPSSNLN